MGVQIGIVGATGLVGAEVLRQLDTGDIPVAGLRLMASARSSGQRLVFRGCEVPVEEVRPELFSGLDLVFLAIGTAGSRELAPEAVARGATVIDKSNAFRMDEGVPLVVPQVNGDAASAHRGIVASPNCSTIQLVMVLAPVERLAGLRRVTVTTFQSVSGSGKAAVDELEGASAARLSGDPEPREAYPHPIAFNVIPQIDSFGPDGYTLEEEKMRSETRKILRLPDLDISATCVRVPVKVGHSEAVLVETEHQVSPVEVRRVLARAPGVAVVDDPGSGSYPMPRDAEGTDDVMVGRIRTDLSSSSGLWMWVVADNLRRGAATNAIDIASLLVAEGLV